MKSMIFSTILLSAIALTACSDDKFAGDEPKDWNGTTDIFTPTEEDAYSTYYKPAIGRVGDPMPFYDAKTGDFKILYLQEYPVNDDKRFHPFWAVSTKDGCNYESLGEIIPVGESRLQQDAALGTGCCYYNEKEGLYYVYYTGHNGNCTNREVVMRATSPDFKTWTKDNLWALKGTDYDLSGQDFRDPQIFEDNGTYHMVISTYKGNDPKFADFTSTDMKTWTFNGDFNMVWDRMCECPDIFKMGNWWYLVYSESYKSDWSRKVKYMMADSFEGLKTCFSDPGRWWPKDDKEGVLDTRAFYAGKTASNGTDRYIWGWCPYRSGVTNDDKNINVGNGKDGQKNEPEWSGALVCHKLIQHSDGTLTIGKVPAMDAKYNKPAEVKVVEKGDDGKTYVAYNRLGAHNHISFTAKTANNEDRFGVSFCFGYIKVKETDKTTGQEVEVPTHSKRYTLMVNPEGNDRRKVNFEQEGYLGMGFIPGADGYLFPRPSDNTYNIDIYTDNSVVTMYINGDYGCTQRIYGLQKNCWTINTYGNDVTISDVKVSQY
ncbi:MAG: DUF4975 domain-containing protein [Bacteroidaceae bacterium]|nr:DUF4975 domain-containing protein [Bacteroidaceae bacterium]